MSGIKFQSTSYGITLCLVDDRGATTSVALTVPEFKEVVRTGSRIAGLPEPWRR